MKPPWKEHPEIEPGSIGWRMGYGEEYMMDFNTWFENQTEEFKRIYSDENPPPPILAEFFVRRGVGQDS